MKLHLKREHFGDTFTVGKLYNGEEFLCLTIEDKFREVDGQPVESWKVPAETAIPKGEYGVTITMSNRFKHELPLLAGVKGFEGVRIHTGNSSKDTEGCIIVGSTWDGKSDFIGGSKLAFDKVFPLIQGATEPVTLSVS